MYPRIVVDEKEHEPARATFYVVSDIPQDPPEDVNVTVNPSYGSHGRIDFTATLAKRSYTAGECAVIRLMTQNDSGLDIQLLSISLCRTYKLGSGSSTVNGQETVETVGVDTTTIKRDFWGCTFLNVVIPAEVAEAPSTSGHVEISYQLHLQVTIPTFGGLNPTSAKIDIPINIHHSQPGIPLKFEAPAAHPALYWRPIWQDDKGASICNSCGNSFGYLGRRHHCRYCGEVDCGDCVSKMPIPNLQYEEPVLVCKKCKPEVERTGGILVCERRKTVTQG